MKRKFLLFFLTVIVVVCISISFSACDSIGDLLDTLNGTETSQEQTDDGNEESSSDDGNEESSSDDGNEESSSDDGNEESSSDDGNEESSSDDGNEESSSDDDDKSPSDDDEQGSSGDNDEQGSSGDDDEQGSSGDDDEQGSSGDDNEQGSSDDDEQSSSGDDDEQSSSGDDDEQSSSGDDDEQGSSGDDEQGSSDDDEQGSSDDEGSSGDTDTGKEDSGETAGTYTARTGNSSYGYYELAGETNGADMQSLYYDLYTACETFSTSTTDITVSSNGYYVITEISYSEYSISRDEAVSVWKVFYLESPMYYWLYSSCVYSTTSSVLYLCIDELYAKYSDRVVYDAAISTMITEANAIISQQSNELEKAIAIHDYIIAKIDYAYQSDGTTPETAIWATI